MHWHVHLGTYVVIILKRYWGGHASEGLLDYVLLGPPAEASTIGIGNIAAAATPDSAAAAFAVVVGAEDAAVATVFPTKVAVAPAALLLVLPVRLDDAEAWRAETRVAPLPIGRDPVIASGTAACVGNW